MKLAKNMKTRNLKQKLLCMIYFIKKLCYLSFWKIVASPLKMQFLIIFVYYVHYLDHSGKT